MVVENEKNNDFLSVITESRKKDKEEEIKLIERHREFIDRLTTEKLQYTTMSNINTSPWGKDYRDKYNSTKRVEPVKKEEEEEGEGEGEGVQLSLKWENTINNGMISLSHLEYAQLMCMTFEGEYYVFLMTHRIASKTDSFIGYTKDPLRDIYLHNSKKKMDHTTAAAAPYWVPNIILGKFFSRMEAIECGLIWVNKARGQNRKKERGEWLGQAFYSNVYDIDKEMSDDTFKEYLRNYVPPFYSQIYDTIMESV